jgi:hypothetical protein
MISPATVDFPHPETPTIISTGGWWLSATDIGPPAIKVPTLATVAPTRVPKVATVSSRPSLAAIPATAAIVSENVAL